MIYSGNLTEFLEFYQVVERQSDSGFKHTEEVFMFKTRAERLKNSEYYTVDAQELYHINELTFRFRFRKEVEETNIVVYQGQRYRITSLNPWKEENQMTIKLSKIND